MATRSETIRKAATQTYDLCIVGGGATGAGCALDAQLRGLRTVLLESGDFAGRTSSASTKMVHGGVRYLQAAASGFDAHQYRLVRHALRERALMLRNAPHLTRSLDFLVPCFGLSDRLYYGLGLKLYDWVAGRGSLGRSRVISRTEAMRRLPGLRPGGLTGAISYSDGQFDDARYCLALIQTFADSGGDALNYARATAFEKDRRGRIEAVCVEDRISESVFEVRARAFVNATGPFADTVRQLASRGAAPRMRPSKGIHLLLPLPEGWTDAMVVPQTEDGRVVFAIPCHGRLLVGTTDEEANADDEMIVTQREADYLLRHINPYLVAPLSTDDVLSGFAGLRPLVMAAGAARTSALIRDDELIVDAQSGLVSIVGGKWTTYRLMAEKTVDRVQQCLGQIVGGCRTVDRRLHGSDGYSEDVWRRLCDDYAVDPAIARHVAAKHGSKARDVLDLGRENPRLGRQLVESAPVIGAEVVYAVRREMARTLEDVLLRRTGLELYSWRMAADAASEAATLMARELDWTSQERERAVNEYTARINRSLAGIGQAVDLPRQVSQDRV